MPTRRTGPPQKCDADLGAYLVYHKVRGRRAAEKCLVAAPDPQAAAEYYVARLRAAKCLPRPAAYRYFTGFVVYLDEYAWDGRPGFKVATDTDGDMWFDVVYAGGGGPTTVQYSERSYA